MKRSLKVLLAAPRSFCAGVTRAIGIVEACLAHYGPPVYVRHAIVHNEHVLHELEQKGAIFVEELKEVPAGAPVIFSAHGVSPVVVQEANRLHLPTVDATCPLVAKVHQEARRQVQAGCLVLVIGKPQHQEVLGLLGHLPQGSYRVIGSMKDAQTLLLPAGLPLAYVTQTTLSTLDTSRIVQTLRERFPQLREPRKETICYATSNRQQALQQIAGSVEALLVLGSYSSSNSARLTEVAQECGCPRVRLVPDPAQFRLSWLDDVNLLGITAGASAPESLVQQLLRRLSQQRTLHIEEIKMTEEQVQFRLPWEQWQTDPRKERQAEVSVAWS